MITTSPICFYGYHKTPSHVKEKVHPCKWVILVPAGDIDDLNEAVGLLRLLNIPDANFVGKVQHENQLHRIFVM